MTKYSPLTMILHWLIAILVIVNWRVAEAAEHASKADHDGIMANHFSFGIVLLILGLAHAVARYATPNPPLASTLRPWEAMLARIVHILLALLVIVLPLMGWVSMSMYGQPIPVFGLFSVPALPLAADKDLGHEIFEIHGTLGEALVYLMALHILGTLKHTLLDRDGNIFRMLPFGNAKA